MSFLVPLNKVKELKFPLLGQTLGITFKSSATPNTDLINYLVPQFTLSLATHIDIISHDANEVTALKNMTTKKSQNSLITVRDYSDLDLMDNLKSLDFEIGDAILITSLQRACPIEANAERPLKYQKFFIELKNLAIKTRTSISIISDMYDSPLLRPPSFFSVVEDSYNEGTLDFTGTWYDAGSAGYERLHKK